MELVQSLVVNITSTINGTLTLKDLILLILVITFGTILIAIGLQRTINCMVTRLELMSCYTLAILKQIYGNQICLALLWHYLQNMIKLTGIVSLLQLKVQLNLLNSTCILAFTIVSYNFSLHVCLSFWSGSCYLSESNSKLTLGILLIEWLGQKTITILL